MLFRSGTRFCATCSDLGLIPEPAARYKSCYWLRRSPMALQFSTLSLRPGTMPAPPPASAPASAALGKVLLERKLITPEQLKIAIEHQRTSNRRIGQVLIDLGFTNADAVLGALSVQLGVPATRLNGYTVNASAVQALPEKLARKHSAVPLQKVGQMLQIAIAVPNNLVALDDLRFASGCQIQTWVALEDEIEAAVNRFYGGRAADAPPVEDTPLPAPVVPIDIERRDLARPDRRAPPRFPRVDVSDDPRREARAARARSERAAAGAVRPRHAPAGHRRIPGDHQKA